MGDLWYIDEEYEWYEPDPVREQALRHARQIGLDEPDEREPRDHRGRHYHYAPGYEPRD